MEYIKFKKECGSILIGEDYESEEIKKLYDEKVAFLKENKNSLEDSQDPNFYLEMLEAIFGVNYYLFLQHKTSKKIDKFVEKYTDVLKDRFNLTEQASLIRSANELNKANVLMETDIDQADDIIEKTMIKFINMDIYDCQSFFRELNFSLSMLAFEINCVRGNLQLLIEFGFDLIVEKLPEINYLSECIYFRLLNNIYADMAFTLNTYHAEIALAVGLAEEMYVNYKEHLQKYNTTFDALLVAELMSEACLATYCAQIYNVTVILYQKFMTFIKEKRIMSNKRVMKCRRKINSIISDDLLNMCYKNINDNDLYIALLAAYKAKVYMLRMKKDDQYVKEFEDSVSPILDKIHDITNSSVVLEVVGDAFESQGQYLVSVYDCRGANRLLFKAAQAFYDSYPFSKDLEVLDKVLHIINFTAEVAFSKESVSQAINIWLSLFREFDKYTNIETYQVFSRYAMIANCLASAFIYQDDYTQAMLCCYHYLGDYNAADLKGEHYPLFEYHLACLHFNLGLSLLHTRGKGDAIEHFEYIKEVIDEYEKNNMKGTYLDELKTLYDYGMSFITTGEASLKHLYNCLEKLVNYGSSEGSSHVVRYEKFKKDALERIEILENYSAEA